MNPSVAVDIVDRDRTGPGRKSAEKGFAGFAKRTQEQAEKSGFAKLGKHLDSLKGASRTTLAFDSLGRSLGNIASLSGRINAALAIGAQKAINFGREGEGALEGVVSTGAKAVGVIGGIATAIVAAGVASVTLGAKWADIGAGVERTARTIGVSVEDLQAAQAAGERFGVDKAATAGGLGALSTELFEATTGKRNDIAAYNEQLGLRTRFDKNGNPDTKAFLYDLSDVIARQKNPQVQREIASAYGLDALLPVLRQGSAAIKAQEQDYLSSGAALSANDTAKATAINRQGIANRQRAGAAEKALGVESFGITETAFNKADQAMRGAKDVIEAIPAAAKSAGHILLEGGKGAADLIVKGAKRGYDVLESLWERIEHQESGGHQFDRHGRTLTSKAGAMGAAQMLPETARETALKHGVAWDPARFMSDQGYNEQLGKLHLGDLMGRFDSDPVLAAAAYNAGAGNVDRWIKKFGDPRKGEISDAEFASDIPFKETRDYVHNTAHVEITLKGAPAGTTAKVTAGKGVSVSANVHRAMGDAG